MDSNSFGRLKDSPYLISGGDDKRVLLWNFLQADNYLLTNDPNVEDSFSHGRIRSSHPSAIHKIHSHSKPLHAFYGHSNNIFSLTFDHQDRRIYSAGLDGKVLMYDIERHAKHPRFNYAGMLAETSGASYLSLQGQVDRSGLVDGTSMPRSSRCDNFHVSFGGSRFCHSDAVYKVELHPFNNHVFLSCSEDKYVACWDQRLHKKDQVAWLLRRPTSVTSIALNPAQPFELVVACNGGLELFDTRKFLLWKNSRHRANVACVKTFSSVLSQSFADVCQSDVQSSTADAFEPRASHMTAARLNESIEDISARLNKGCVRQSKRPSMVIAHPQITSVSFHSQGNYFLTSVHNFLPTIFHVNDEDPVLSFHVPGYRNLCTIKQYCFNNTLNFPSAQPPKLFDGQDFVACGSEDYNVYFFPLPKSFAAGTTAGHRSSTFESQALTHSQRMEHLGPYAFSYFYNPNTKNIVNHPIQLHYPASSIVSGSCTPLEDGPEIVKPLQVIGGYESNVNVVTFHPNLPLMASCGVEKHVHLHTALVDPSLLHEKTLAVFQEHPVESERVSRPLDLTSNHVGQGTPSTSMPSRPIIFQTQERLASRPHGNIGPSSSVVEDYDMSHMDALTALGIQVLGPTLPFHSSEAPPESDIEFFDNHHEAPIDDINDEDLPHPTQLVDHHDPSLDHDDSFFTSSNADAESSDAFREEAFNQSLSPSPSIFSIFNLSRNDSSEDEQVYRMFHVMNQNEHVDDIFTRRECREIMYQINHAINARPQGPDNKKSFSDSDSSKNSDHDEESQRNPTNPPTAPN